MADIKWIKITTNIFDNRKIKQIENLPDGDAIIVVWLKLICLAGLINDDGKIYLTPEIPYTEEMLATQFSRNVTLIRVALQSFKMFGMIEIIDDVFKISNWEKYQSANELAQIREQTRKRVEKFRQNKQIPAQCNATVTLPVTHCNGTELELEQELDIECKHSIRESKKDTAFESFWGAYPKKVGKADALKAWKKNKAAQHINKALKTIERMKATDQWQREGGRFIPNPATWINQGRWDDEVEGRQDDLDDLF